MGISKELRLKNPFGVKGLNLRIIIIRNWGVRIYMVFSRHFLTRSRKIYRFFGHLYIFPCPLWHECYTGRPNYIKTIQVFWRQECFPAQQALLTRLFLKGTKKPSPDNVISPPPTPTHTHTHTIFFFFFFFLLLLFCYPTQSEIITLHNPPLFVECKRKKETNKQQRKKERNITAMNCSVYWHEVRDKNRKWDKWSNLIRIRTSSE